MNLAPTLTPTCSLTVALVAVECVLAERLSYHFKHLGGLGGQNHKSWSCVHVCVCVCVSGIIRIVGLAFLWSVCDADDGDQKP